MDINIVLAPFLIRNTFEKFPTPSALIAEQPAFNLLDVWLNVMMAVLSVAFKPAYEILG